MTFRHNPPYSAFWRRPGFGAGPAQPKANHDTNGAPCPCIIDLDNGTVLSFIQLLVVGTAGITRAGKSVKGTVE